jgi:hypothetical protein
MFWSLVPHKGNNVLLDWRQVFLGTMSVLPIGRRLVVDLILTDRIS